MSSSDLSALTSLLASNLCTGLLHRDEEHVTADDCWLIWNASAPPCDKRAMVSAARAVAVGQAVMVMMCFLIEAIEDVRFLCVFCSPSKKLRAPGTLLPTTRGTPCGWNLFLWHVRMNALYVPNVGELR